MTTPTIVSSKYTSVSNPYLICKADRSGAERTEYFTVTVPASTAAASIIGLVPFRQGACFNYGSTIYIPDWDTGTTVTINIGYVYDNNVTFTNDADAFASLLTTGQTAGFVTFDEIAGLSWKAAGDGWIAITLATGPTTTQVAVEGQITLFYDQ